MPEISIVHNAPEDELRKLRVRGRPVWTKEVSEFPWHYDERETSYIPGGAKWLGHPMTVDPLPWIPRPGRFPRDLSCTWQVRKGVRKHYNFG